MGGVAHHALPGEKRGLKGIVVGFNNSYRIIKCSIIHKNMYLQDN